MAVEENELQSPDDELRRMIAAGRDIIGRLRQTASEIERDVAVWQRRLEGRVRPRLDGKRKVTGRAPESRFSDRFGSF